MEENIEDVEFTIEQPKVEEVVLKKSKKVPTPVPTVQLSDKCYKMNLYSSNGLLRPSLSRGTFTIMSTKYGDIIRSISSGHWCTVSEIAVAYANLAKRLRFRPLRSQEQIAMAIRDMVEAGMIEVK